MKYDSLSLLWAPVVFVALSSCAPSPPCLPVPSVGGIKAEIGDAKQVIRAARSSAERIGGGISSARTKAERIEGKAAVILEHWQ